MIEENMNMIIDSRDSNFLSVSCHCLQATSNRQVLLTKDMKNIVKIRYQDPLPSKLFEKSL